MCQIILGLIEELKEEKVTPFCLFHAHGIDGLVNQKGKAGLAGLDTCSFVAPLSNYSWDYIYIYKRCNKEIYIELAYYM